MQTRLTNSFITSARLISAQTLPRARWETGTLRPPAAPTQPLPWPWVWHTWGIRLGGPGQRPALGDTPGNWGHSLRAGGGTCGGTVPVGSQGTCQHSVPIVPSTRHVPDWPGAGPCRPALASDPAGSLPGRGWHRHPPGVTTGAAWGGKVGAGGALADARVLQVSIRAAAGSWAVPGDAAAPGWGSPRGSTGSSWLGASLSRQDGARLKASDKLFDGSESCQLLSSAPCREQSAGGGDPCVWRGRQGWHPQAPLGTAGHALPSP